VPDRVDTAVHRVQLASMDAVVDLVARHARSKQLGTADDAVLALGELGDHRVDRASLQLTRTTAIK
jgi:hypothetical protein